MHDAIGANPVPLIRDCIAIANFASCAAAQIQINPALGNTLCKQGDGTSLLIGTCDPRDCTVQRYIGNRNPPGQSCDRLGSECHCLRITRWEALCGAQSNEG